MSGKKRAYWQSSSFIMALCFTGLLGSACVFLAYTIYSFSRAVADPSILQSWTWQQPVLLALSVVMITAMVVVIALSFFISVYVVNRINRIAELANRIVETGDLTQRIELSTRWDDLSFLALGINKLLGRLESLVQAVEHVSDNIAHDLRTPLTRVRNRLELDEHGRRRTPEIYTAERAHLIEDVDALLVTFDTVLRISQLESRGRAKAFKSVQLDQIVQDVLELYGPVAEERSITIRREGSCHVVADRNLLFQLLANLIDNALKFSPEGAEVLVRLIDSLLDGNPDEKTGPASALMCQLEVWDQGPGMTLAQRVRATERFYCGDTSRNSKGSGLGLAMAKAIVDHHEGDLKFESVSERQPKGLRVLICLPKLGKSETQVSFRADKS